MNLKIVSVAALLCLSAPLLAQTADDSVQAYRDGDYAQALSLARDPDGAMPPETAAIGARAQRHLGLLEDAGRTLETALATPGLPAEAEVQLRFSLGRVRDESGDFAAAADLLREANRRQQARFGVAAAESDLEQFARAVDRITALSLDIGDKRAVACIHAATRAFFFQKDIDDARNRVRSILRRRPIAQHLNTADRCRWDRVQVDCGRSATNRTVDIDERG